MEEITLFQAGEAQEGAQEIGFRSTNFVKQPRSLDRDDKYVYTYSMSNPVFKSKLTEVSKEASKEISQIPATCMGMHIRRASRIVTQIYDTALRPVGLVLNQFTLLVSIHLLESIPITRLAEELFTDQTTLTRNLKPLEKRGLVAIEPGNDRRVKLVSLTAEGQAVLIKALPLWKQAQAEVVQHFGPQKSETLLSLLSDVKEM